MSRQNKNRRVIAKRIQVTSVHKQGGKIDRTKKLTSVNKGLCKVVTVKNTVRRVSVNTKVSSD